MSKARFDPTITLGHILTAATIAIGGVAAFYGTRAELAKVGGDLSNVDRRLISVEAHIAKLTDILIADARQDARITNLERWRDRVEAQAERRPAAPGLAE